MSKKTIDVNSPAIQMFAKSYLAGFKEGQAKLSKKIEKLNNATGLTDIVFGGAFNNNFGGTDQMSNYQTLANANNYNLITRNWVVLAYMYVTNGIVQAIVDTPAEDAMRGGLKFKSKEINPEECEELDKFMTRKKYYDAIKQAVKWARLFGGAGMIINAANSGKADTPLKAESLAEGTKMKLLPADRWELAQPINDIYNYAQYDELNITQNTKAVRVHKSRVIRVSGKASPSLVRRQLQGWGISSIEHLVRNLNQYTKDQETIFELVDKWKTDVLKITGYNQAIISKTAEASMMKAIQLVARMKNNKNTIAMDAKDDYVQITASASGLAELSKQNMVRVAADVRLPMTKLFGLSAAGFNAGEDDIENYNALVEGEPRAMVDEILEELMPVICMIKFGHVIDDLSWEFKPLRIMGAKEEEEVKTLKQQRIDAQHAKGLYNDQEYAQALRQEGLLPITVEVESGAEMVPPAVMQQEEAMAGQEAKEKPKSKLDNARETINGALKTVIEFLNKKVI